MLSSGPAVLVPRVGWGRVYARQGGSVLGHVRPHFQSVEKEGWCQTEACKHMKHQIYFLHNPARWGSCQNECSVSKELEHVWKSNTHHPSTIDETGS